MKRPLVFFALSLLSVPFARAADWPDTFESRVEIVAIVQTINAEILASPSATRTLEAWCGEHHMAPEAKIVAIRATGVQKQPSAEQLARLGVHDAAELRYRHVELRCGAHVFSEADNWYVAARLTPEMNRLLDTTDTPFGTVVRPLDPYRRTIGMTMLWSPLPRDWEQQPRPRSKPQRDGLLALPRDLFQHRAVLYTGSHVAFAEVVETYRRDLLDFAH